MGIGMDSDHDSQDGTGAEHDGAGVTFIRGMVPSPSASGPLPRGQHDLSPEYVARHQRTRILDATTYVLAEHGYGAATIGEIVARAHVSRRTFYAHFETKEHCVLATFGAALECIADAVRAAYTAEDEWDAAVAAGLHQLMLILVEHPQTARTCFVEMRAVGDAAVEPLRAARGMCMDALRQALTDRPDGPAADDIALEIGVGGLIALIRERLTADEAASLQEALPQIAGVLLEPLAGPEASAAVVARLESGPRAQAVHAI